MKRLAVVLFPTFLLASGCATAHPTGDFGTSWTAQRCQALLDQRDALTWAAAFGGGLSGVGGLSTAFPDDSRKDVRLGLGISAAVLAAASTSMVALAKIKSSEFEMYCGTEPPAPAVVERDGNTVVEMMPIPDELVADGGV
jgi:hypothetical protein